MPSCSACLHLVDGKCELANIKEGMKLQQIVKEASRSCMYAVMNKYIPTMSGTVLEIGYGMSRVARRNVKRHGCKWYGVDPKHEVIPKSGRLKGTAASIPLPNNSVDWVIAFETMEHWEEFGETPAKGIAESFRVLKPGGSMLVTVPIHQHGADAFIFGDISTIVSWFGVVEWQSVLLTEWRKEYAPLPRLEEWVSAQRQRMISKLGHVPSMWKLEILARK